MYVCYYAVLSRILIAAFQPEPLKDLNELAKAQVCIYYSRNSIFCLSLPQLIFYATAAEALSTVQGEIEELSVAAEGEYRSVLSLFLFPRQ